MLKLIFVFVFCFFWCQYETQLLDFIHGSDLSWSDAVWSPQQLSLLFAGCHWLDQNTSAISWKESRKPSSTSDLASIQLICKLGRASPDTVSVGRQLTSLVKRHNFQFASKLFEHQAAQRDQTPLDYWGTRPLRMRPAAMRALVGKRPKEWWGSEGRWGNLINSWAQVTCSQFYLFPQSEDNTHFYIYLTGGSPLRNVRNNPSRDIFCKWLKMIRLFMLCFAFLIFFIC